MTSNTEESTKTDNTKYITEQDPDGIYVTIAEYIRRKHELDLKKDALAIPLRHTSLYKPIERGEIEIFKQGENKFIDWNKYKNFVFKRYRQMPKKKTKAKQ